MSNATDWAVIAQKLHQDCRALEGKLAEVTKQRDELMKSIRSFQTNSDAFSELLRFSQERIAEVTKQRDAFRNELSKVMPPDYKDWWENDKNEWPIVARLTIESKRQLIDMDQETIERMERELAEALEWKRMLSSWGGTPEIVDSFIKGQQERIAAAQEAEKERDEWKELYERLNESLASNKRLFSSKLAEKIIDDQVKRIKFLEDKYSETQKELLELKKQ